MLLWLLLVPVLVLLLLPLLPLLLLFVFFSRAVFRHRGGGEGRRGRVGGDGVDSRQRAGLVSGAGQDGVLQESSTRGPPYHMLYVYVGVRVHVLMIHTRTHTRMASTSTRTWNTVYTVYTVYYHVTAYMNER